MTTPVLGLPRTAPLEVFVRALALAGDASRFASQIAGPAVLIRLDERGGPHEPAPWAFPTLERMEALLVDRPDSDDVFLDIDKAASDEATATGPAQPPLPLPPARERATVFVVPKGGGRVGRAQSSAVRIVERSVSRQHAMIAIGDDESTYSLLDVDADNGTRINGMELVPGAAHPLRSGDVVAFADVTLLFLDVRALASHMDALLGR